ncbi:MAG TPA: hypothetical protein PLR30_07095 [Saprospiraceae bacterium]|nr:hypothetical protein [Saprospiraceae bacterium]
MRQIQLIGWFYLPVGSSRFPVGFFSLNTPVKIDFRSKVWLAKRKVKVSKRKILLDSFEVVLHL